MKRNLFLIALIISGLLLAGVSCKKKTEEPEPTPSGHWYSPEPGENGTLPTSVLPSSVADSVLVYYTVYSGENPPTFNGEFVSHPHVLIHSTVATDTVTTFSDRYICFRCRNGNIDFFGQQWDPEIGAHGGYYEEAYRGLHLIGTGENFTCYYLTEAYPNGRYAKFSTIFSGKWNENYGGLKDFQVAVVMLETSGNPNLAPPGSFRVLGDGDGLAHDTAWMPTKGAFADDMVISAEDAFRMFRVK